MPESERMKDSIYNQLMHKDGLGHIFNHMQQTWK